MNEYKDFTSREQEVAITSLIKYYEESIPELRFNTCVSKAMEFINFLSQERRIDLNVWKNFLTVFAPFAPFITEQLWSYLHESDDKGYQSVHTEKWPTYDENILVTNIVKVAVQINGKVRGIIEVKKDASQDEVVKVALEDEKLKNYMMADKSEFAPKKVLYVNGKILAVVN